MAVDWLIAYEDYFSSRGQGPEFKGRLATFANEACFSILEFQSRQKIQNLAKGIKIRKISTYRASDIKKDEQIKYSQDKLIKYLRLNIEERYLRRAPIDESVFYREDILHAVQSRCMGKCVYCERKLEGDVGVDHYRPLRDARDLNGTVHRDSYNWLAYEFENFVYTCDECRNSKASLFPVDGERAIRLTRMQDINRLEKPMILNPYRDQISAHLVFLYNGRCIPKSQRGEITIKALNLNRLQLVLERSKDIELFMQELRLLIISPIEYISEISGLDPERQFSGVRINLLQRLLKGLTLGGSTIYVTASRVAGEFEHRMRRGVSDSEKAILLNRLSNLSTQDQNRQRLDRDESPDPDESIAMAPSTWSNVNRSGGVSHIEIQNFKGIRSLSLDIPSRIKSRTAPCLMLLGENSAGKSSVLQAVALAVLGTSEARRLKLKSRDYLSSRLQGQWDQLTPEDARVSLRFRFGSEASFRLDAALDTYCGDVRTSGIVLGYGPRRYFDRENSKISNRASARVTTLFHPKATIPYPGAWLNQISKAEFEQVAQVLRAVLTLSDNDRILRDDENQIGVELDGQFIPLDLLSEGYKSVISMSVDIVRELIPTYPIIEDAEAVVLIDEIETHLHPRWKMRIMSGLRRALPRVQFIVTTHDPLCLRGMDDDEVIVLQRTASHAVAKLENLPSVRGMRADQLLTSDYFGLSSTVDPKIELDMARYVSELRGLREGAGSEADRLIEQLTIGNDAQELVIREAMRQFIKERERPLDKPRTEISKVAVQAVLEALRGGASK